MATVTTYWAWRDRGGHVHPVIDREANEAYMSAEQLARRMAEKTGGKAVMKTVRIEESDWEEVE